HGLNASGRSPAGWSLERFKGQPAMPQRGWESVTVPGAVMAWRDMSEKFGKLPFADLFEPAIKYAAEGYMVTPTIARQWAAGAAELHSQPGFADALMPRRRAPEPGEKFSFPAQAKTLQRIAETKGEAFYNGELAEKIAAFAKQHGAALTLADLPAHSNDWVEPIGIDYRGYTLHEIPPNGQGIAALIALGILQHFDVAAMKVDGADSQHVQIAAMELAFADVYRHVAERSAMEVTTAQMLDPGYLASRAKLIDMKR